jgi:hypothetical protein
MDKAIRHYADDDGYYNGSEGLWTVCGLEWSRQPKGALVTDCPDCARLRQERISVVRAEWQ